MAGRTRIYGMRPFTIRFISPLLRPFAGWLPGFGILTYRGRKSGRVYNTPINVFKRGDRYVVVLTYGSDVEWVKNVLAQGGCEMQTRGRTIRLVDPELVPDPELRSMPWFLRWIGVLNGVSETLRMRPVG